MTASVKRSALLLLLVFAARDCGTSANEAKCRTGCQGITPNTFKYEVGKTYKYSYEGTIEVSLSTAEGQVTGTKVKANVLLSQQADCNQVLKLQNVQIFGADGKVVEGKIANIDRPIQLNFHDGHLEDVVCVEAGETQNSLNVKRAIASMFQATPKHNHETDVFGNCPTEISTHKEGATLHIQKSRYLNKCAYRESIQQDFLATAFDLNSEIKSSPILNGDYVAQMVVKDGVLEESTVVEEYLYVPFSVGKNGARAKVVSKLKFGGVAGDAVKGKFVEVRSVIFENPHIEVAAEANVNSLLAAVKAVGETVGEVVGKNTSRRFVDLVKIIREAKTEDLLGVYNQVSSGAGFSDKEVAKKVFLDALFRAGTGEGIEVAMKLLHSNKLNELEKYQVYLGLSFIKHATKSSLSEAAKLLDQPDLPRVAYLGVGNLAGKFCKEHSCKGVDDFQKLVQKLLSKLEDGKATTRKKENEIVYILKAIANIHYLPDNVLNKISDIAKDNKQPIRVRVTALEAFLADACKDKLRNVAINILKDIQQDSEIRIKAYLALAQCPNGKVATAVKTLLENEPSYQVGGFIVTHLRNVKASAFKVLAKEQLGQIHLPSKYPFDFRKYSFNGEFSYAIDTLGVASQAETNVIYSQRSFLPRSISLNLTTELFGHSFNFLEVATRQENLDRLLEHFIGPQGVYGDDYHREKRDLKSEIAQIAKQTQIKTNNLNSDLDLDLSVRVFGSEVAFVNLNDDARKYSPDSLLEKAYQKVKGTADEAKHFRKTLRSNSMFIDAELAYPTSLGFPLRLAVEGTAAIQVFANTNIDINPNQKSEVKLNLIPSANVEIAGRMTLDAHLVENGLRVSSTLYTATGGDLKVEVFENGNGFDVKFGLPVSEQRIASASHDIVFNTRYLGQEERYQPLKFSQNNEFALCFDQLSPFVGVTVCGEISGPNLAGDHVPVLPFPFSGNAKYDVAVKRDDVKLYHVRFENMYASTKKRGVEFVAEAINMKNEKMTAINFEAYYDHAPYLKLSLISPIKKATAEARIIRNDNEKALMLQLQHDNKEYYGKLGVSVSGDSQKSIYKPIFEYRTPGDKNAQRPPYHVEGQVIHEKNEGKFTFDNVKIVMPNQKAIEVNGNMGYDDKASPRNAFVDLTVSNGDAKAVVKEKFQWDDNTRKLNLEVQNSFNPEANFNLKYEYVKKDKEVFGNFQLIHGQDLSSKTNIISASSKSKYYYNTPKDFALEADNKFSYPLFEIKSELDFHLTPKTAGYDVELQYRDVKIGSELDVKVCQKLDGDYDFEFEVYGLENRLEIEAKREIVTEGLKSKIQNSLEVNGKKYEVSGTVNHQIKPHNVNVGADVVVKVAERSDPIDVKSGFIFNPNEVDANLKIDSGSTTYIDSFIKASRGGNANGSIKVNIKDILTVNGQIKAQKGSGNGEITVDFPKRNRKLKGDVTFTIHPDVDKKQVYSVQLAIFPDYGRDQKKKLVISTDTKITSTTADSQNFIEYQNQKIALNGKGTVEGQFNNGKTHVEIELILPNDFYAVTKYSREIVIENDIANGGFTLTFENRDNKNTPGRKVSLKGTARNTSIKWDVIDVVYNFIAEDTQGRSLNADVIVKRELQNELVNNLLQIKAHGSVIKDPIDGLLQFGHSGGYKTGTYRVAGSYGPNTNVQVNGEYRADVGLAYVGLISADVKTPYTALKLFRFKADGAVNLPRTPQDFLTAKGLVNVFLDGDGSNPDASVDFATEGQLMFKEYEGSYKGMVRYQKQPPVSVDLQFKHQHDKIEKCFFIGLLQYGAGKAVKAELTHVSPDKNDHSVDIKLVTPSEKAKNVDIKLQTKRSVDGNAYNNNAVVSVDGKTYTVANEIVLSQISPVFRAEITFPDGKVDELAFKANKVSDKVFDGALKAVCHANNFIFDGSYSVNFEDVDDFTIKYKIDSPSLKLDKVTLEISNKAGGKGGKRININAKSGNKNLVSGSMGYKVHVEGNKYIVEGSGNLKVKEESKSANFKYIKEVLSSEKNGEKGIQTSLNAAVGSNAIDSEFKLTNKQFRLATSSCEEKKQCTHVEIDSKTSVNDIQNYNNELEISIDLRKLGFAHEFGLKAVTNRKQLQFDHTVDVHFQDQTNSKYQYSVYMHPKKAGASLTTPKRIVSIEGVYSYDKELKGEIAAYLDKKNKPNEKTSITVYAGLDKSNDKLKANAEFKSPAIDRTLSASYVATPYKDAEKGFQVEVILDIFPKQNQKLVILQKSTVTYGNEISSKRSLEIKSAGLKVDVKIGEAFSLDKEKMVLKYKSGVRFNVKNQNYDSGVSITANKNQIDFQERLFNRDIFKLYSTEIKATKDLIKLAGIVEIYGSKPWKSELEIKNLNTLKYIAHPKDEHNDRFEINAAFIVGQIADFRADSYVSGAKKELLHSSLKLDESNFLKADYGINSENIKAYVLDRAKEDVKKQVKSLQELVPELYKEVSGQAQAVVESGDAEHLRSLKSYYVSEGQKIRDEFLEDKTISDLSNFIKSIIGAAAQTIGEIFASFSEFAENVVKTIQANFSRVYDSFNRELLPKLKETTEKIVSTAAEIIDKFSEVAFAYIARITQFLEEHQADFKEIVAGINAAGQDVVRFILKAYQSVRENIEKQVSMVYEEIKAFPMFEELKHQWEQIKKEGFAGSEAIVNTFRDVAATLKDAAPTPELKQLVGSISDYIEKKLRGQKVDDVAEIQKILKSIQNIVGKAVQGYFSGDLSTPDVQKVPIFSIDYLYKLPKLVAIRFSPLSYLLSTDALQDPSQFLYGLSFNPRHYVIPIPHYGILVQGKHIFTFDGKHITFPGNCDYLLARDAFEGNFTVVGTFKDGILVAITVADRKDSITLKQGAAVLLNGSPIEFPVHKPTIEAFRLPGSVTVVSKAGVEVTCGLNLVACGVHVSGFYHGRLRGLLGNGNFEPYDDFTAADGKIVSSESVFGNSYRMQKCEEVKAVEGHEHSGHHGAASPSCAKLFGYESSLRYCFRFVNPENWRTACEHGVAAGDKETEFAVAVGYVAACNYRGIPIRLPQEFVKCDNSEKPYRIGETFSVKLPNKAADIFLLVDLVSSNAPIYKDFLVPLTQQISKDLAGKGISDIEFHLITYGGADQQHYPHYVTSDGKISFKSPPSLKFSDPKPTDYKVDCSWLLNSKFVKDHFSVQYVKNKCEEISDANALVHDVLHDINLATGRTAQARTYAEALKYPSRTYAARTIIALTGDQCEVGRFLPLQIIRSLFYYNKQINLNLITPLKNVEMKDAKQTKDVIGFNKHGVFLASEAKKKPDGNTELLKQLKYDDFCSHFTTMSGGNVFVSNNFAHAKDKYVQVASHNIVDQIVNKQMGLECECKFANPYNGVNVCNVAYLKTSEHSKA